jgi:hypothetical protein
MLYRFGLGSPLARKRLGEVHIQGERAFYVRRVSDDEVVPGAPCEIAFSPQALVFDACWYPAISGGHTNSRYQQKFGTLWSKLVLPGPTRDRQNQSWWESPDFLGSA